MTNKLALIGKNTENSLSPAIYQFLAEKKGFSLEYRKISTPPEKFPEVLKKCKAYKGFNLTSPYKAQGTNLLKSEGYQLSPSALQIGHGNTIYDQKIYNTDIYGIEKTLHNYQNLFEGLRIVILGKGDVTKTLLNYLGDLGIFEVTLLNRESTPSISELQSLKETEFLINATPLGSKSHPIKDLCSLNSIKFAFDLNYNSSHDQVKKHCQKIGATFFSGTSMLIWQALKNFEIWFETKLEEKDKLHDEILAIL